MLTQNSFQFPWQDALRLEYLGQEASHSQTWVQVHACNPRVNLQLLIELPTLISKAVPFWIPADSRLECVCVGVKDRRGTVQDRRQEGLPSHLLRVSRNHSTTQQSRIPGTVLRRAFSPSDPVPQGTDGRTRPHETS